MPIKVSDNVGVMRDASPRIFSGYWRNTAAWVFSDGAWRRTYDPSDENLLTNSRMMNGTDYYTYINGETVGYAPPGWTWFSNTPDGQSNAYAVYSANLDEYSRGYKMISNGSRLFMTSRVYARAGSTYEASVYIDEISVISGRRVASITIDGIPATEYSKYFVIDKDFERMGNINGRISSKVRVLKDCVLAFNIGIGVDANDTGYVRVNRPMLSKTSKLIDYQPTPKSVVYNAVYLVDSMISPVGGIQTTNGTYHMEFSGIIENANRGQYLVMVSRKGSTQTNEIAIDLTNHRLVTMVDGVVTNTTNLIRAIPSDQIVGIGMWFDIVGGYVKNIRLHINGQLVGLIESQTITLSRVDTFIGSGIHKTSGVIVEQFSFHVGDTSYCFNLEEGSGSTTKSSYSEITASFNGSEGTDFIWWAVIPMITLQPNPTYNATTGDTVTITTEATDWSTVEWRTQHGPIAGAMSPVLTIQVTADFDYTQEFYAVYKTRFGSMSTNKAVIVDSNPT